MAFKMNPKSPLLMKAMGMSPAKTMNSGSGPTKTSSPAKQAKITDEMYKKRDMKIYGDLDKAEFDKEANRQINVRNKKFKDAKARSKANSGGTQTQTNYSGGQTSDGSCSREDDACNAKGQSIRKRDIGYDVPKTKMKSKVKSKRKIVSAGTTLKPEVSRLEGGVAVTKTAMPTGKPIGAKEIKVAKPTRSQKIRAKAGAEMASGNTSKAQRLDRRSNRVEAREKNKANRVEAREKNKASRKAARASRQIAKGEKKNKMTMTKSKVAKKAKPVKRKVMDPSRMEN